MKTFVRFRSVRAVVVAIGLASAFVTLANVVAGNSVTAFSTNVLASQVTLTVPPDAVSGDTLLAAISVNGGSSAAVTAPAGWTFIAVANNASDIGIWSYYKRLSASDPQTYTWIISPQARAIGGMTRYSGVSINPIDVVATSKGHSTIATTPSITTTGNNEQIVVLFATNNGTAVSQLFSTSPGMTMRYKTKYTPLGPTAAAEDTNQATAGTVGPLSSSFALTARDWASQIIALRSLGSIGSGLSAYWTFDDATGTSVADAMGNHTGTWNGALGSQWTPGIQRSGGSFNGSDNVVTMTNDPISGQPAWTISAWVYPTALNASNVIFGNRESIDGHIGAGVTFTVNGTDRQGCDLHVNSIIVSLGELGSYEGNNVWTTPDDSITLNQWHHVAWAWTDNGSQAVYIDGISQPLSFWSCGGNSGSGAINWTGAPIPGIGNSTAGYTNAPFTGKIDEVGVWHRALSASEVTSLYNSGNGLSYPF